MSNHTDTPDYRDPDFLAGQFEALRALILGLAECVPPDRFVAAAKAHLEALIANLVASPRPSADRRVAALREYDRWLDGLRPPA